MIGRAGRPQFDTSGVGEFQPPSLQLLGEMLIVPCVQTALIMTESPQKSRYEALVNSEVSLTAPPHRQAELYPLDRPCSRAASTRTSPRTSTPRSTFAVRRCRLIVHLASTLTRFSTAAITDIASALHWLRSTFLFVRIKKNPRFYAIANRAATSPNARLEEIVVESVKALVSEGIVDETEDMISPTSEYRI